MITASTITSVLVMASAVIIPIIVKLIYDRINKKF
jgi:hypothetical protein